ncbi:MAG: hypothetical protein A2493_02135 [Candidatus Magasanikbacteria bacterium RIFOXYC12_FULL_33_11]|uniref:riboflavin kinase n=1 Tax=Candidatus Magasanikbacteria bacterium RIFOXYC12_FULL_33_11 TaxID=1798701 RepID=A0A1F6NT00_9BACT|nr:MAG: hypothetical protein A2493_02135 [Candidatus Magasanikbacteria bacterium RIFOXYC12_FULL_33_11]
MYSGIVVKGEGVAKKFGFPTANIDCQLKKNTKVATGVFAAISTVEKKKYNSTLIILPKGDSYKFEIHFLDFVGDLYGKYLEVDLVQKVSEIESYDSEEELLEKIRHDVEMVKEVFSSRK